MKITKGEYCQFSLRSRMAMLKEFGQLEMEKDFGYRSVRVFVLYDFYVEVIYNRLKSKIEKAEPVSFTDLLEMYDEQDPA